MIRFKKEDDINLSKLWTEWVKSFRMNDNYDMANIQWGESQNCIWISHLNLFRQRSTQEGNWCNHDFSELCYVAYGFIILCVNIFYSYSKTTETKGRHNHNPKFIKTEIIRERCVWEFLPCFHSPHSLSLPHTHWTRFLCNFTVFILFVFFGSNFLLCNDKMQIDMCDTSYLKVFLFFLFVFYVY